MDNSQDFIKEDGFKCNLCDKAYSYAGTLWTHKMFLHYDDIQDASIEEDTNNKNHTLISENQTEQKNKLTLENLNKNDNAICSTLNAASLEKHAIKSPLKTHMKKQSGERPYKCKLCDFSSEWAYSLKMHISNHSGDKPYQCTMGFAL